MLKKKEVLHNTVYQLRQQKNITQQDLADVIGVTRQTIIAIEKGNYVPSVLLALKIAHYFHTTIEKIFTYERK